MNETDIQEETCDNCGTNLDGKEYYKFEEVPYDISKVEKGKPAVVCLDCIARFEEALNVAIPDAMPNKVVFVFAFDMPEDATTMGKMLQQAKASFYDKQNVKVYAAKDAAADFVIEFFNTGDDPASNLVRHARRELTLIGEDEDTIEMYLRVVRAFSSGGHSGGSAAAAIPVINKLLQFQPLSPLTDAPDEWMNVTEMTASGTGLWQSTRNPEAFSEDGGKTYHLVSERKDERKIYETVKKEKT